MFADSRESIAPRIRQAISGQKTMGRIFCTSTRLLVLEAVPKGPKFNQDYFVDAIFPELYNETRRMSRKEAFPVLPVHMDNSMSHHGDKVSEKLAKRSIERAPHPPYSPNISPSAFWLFGMLKHKMKDQEFENQQAHLSAIAKMGNDLTFADVPCVFKEWIERLTWVVVNNGEYYRN